MKREQSSYDLRKAFAPMPEECRQALMDAARSVKEEKPTKRASSRAVLIAAIIIVATMAAAFAATQLGWVDSFGSNYGVTVPKAAEEALVATQPRRYQVGPMTFTFNQLLTDARIALSSAEIHTTDGSEALYADDTNVYEAVDAISDTVLNRYKLESGVTWMDAARQLSLPLYGIRALIEVGEPYSAGESMEDALWNEDGSIVYFNMPLLLSKNVRDELPATLYMAVTQFDPATGEELERWRLQEEITIPASPLTAEKTYLPESGAELDGMKLVDVYAEQYATGIYLTAAFIMPDGTDADKARDALYSLTLCGSDGAALPGGLNLSIRSYLDAWPTVALETMTSLEALPDSLIVTDGITKITVK